MVWGDIRGSRNHMKTNSFRIVGSASWKYMFPQWKWSGDPWKLPNPTLFPLGKPLFPERGFQSAESLWQCMFCAFWKPCSGHACSPNANETGFHKITKYRSVSLRKTNISRTRILQCKPHMKTSGFRSCQKNLKGAQPGIPDGYWKTFKNYWKT